MPRQAELMIDECSFLGLWLSIEENWLLQICSPANCARQRRLTWHGKLCEIYLISMLKLDIGFIRYRMHYEQNSNEWMLEIAIFEIPVYLWSRLIEFSCDRARGLTLENWFGMGRNMTQNHACWKGINFVYG